MTARGNSPVSSWWAATGMISLRTKSRAVWIKASCSSDRVRSNAMGGMLASPTRPGMAEELGSYRLHRTINVGSIGEVFLAERIGDTAIGRPREPVVVKRLHRELARLPEHVELFREE